ncbi:MAG: hypothetical protein ABIN08_24740 [Caldimonas sp.]
MSGEFDHVVLTEKQERFLEKYLGRKSAKSSKAELKKRQGRTDYKAFLGAEEAIKATSRRLREAGVDVASLEQRLNQISDGLQGEKPTLKLADAVERAALLRKEANELLARMEQKEGIFSSLSWLGTPPPGAGPNEVLRLTHLCTELRHSLPGMPPTRQALDTAVLALGKASKQRMVIVESCVVRRRDSAAVSVEMGELQQRLADARARLAMLSKPPPDATVLAGEVEKVLASMRASLDRREGDGIDAARQSSGKASLALSKLEAMLQEGFDQHARQAIEDAGAQPVGIQLLKLSKSNPGAFNSAVSVLAGLRTQVGGEIDDLALKAVEVEVKQKEAAISMSKHSENEILKEMMLAAGNADAGAPSGRRGNRGAAIRPGQLSALSQPDEENEQVRALRERLEMAQLLTERRVADLERTKGKVEAARAVSDLMDALRNGPLSAGHGREIKGPAASEIIALFGKNPAIARDCLAAATKAEHPDSVARCGTIVCNFLDDAKLPPAYASRLVQASGSCDAATMDALPGYLAQGRMREAIELGGKSENAEARREARTGHVRQAALRADGTLDIAAGRNALLDVMFHPDALASPTPVQAAHMQRTLAFFETTPEAAHELRRVEAPVNASPAAAMVARSNGQRDSTPSQQATRAAVMNAMLTPVYQGEVGSCFATSGVIALRETRPLEALKALKGIACEGIYRPRKGDPVPAVNNPNVTGDPLIRSLEYSAATATAKSERSSKRALLLERNTRAISNGLPPSIIRSAPKKGASAFAQGELNQDLVSRLASAISKAVDFDYDPSRSTPIGADGRSEAGVYVMRSTKTGDVITPDFGAVEAKVAPVSDVFDADSRNAALAQVKKNAEEEAGDKYWANIEPILLEILRDHGTELSDQHRATTKKFFLDACLKGGNSPWQPTAGGQTHEAAAVIHGLDGKQTEMTQEVEKNAVKPGRAEAVMLNTMKSFFARRNQGEDMVVMRTVGQHGFNGLPTHPSLAPLLDGGEKELEANFKRQVVDKGKALHATPLPQARLLSMFRKDATALAGDDAGLLAQLMKEPPDRDMTPGEYQSYLGMALRFASGAGMGHPTEAQRLKGAEADSLVKRRMIEELDVPQFVIADTNWGRPDFHVYFVMVPDPITGDLNFFERIDPGGILKEPSGGAAEWLCKSWAIIS